MSLRHEHNNGAGGGGNAKIESPDGSLNVTENGNVTEVSVNWNEMPETEVTSEDGSVEVTNEPTSTGEKYDLSVPLATEERKGLISPSGKYQIDHAQLIQTNEQVSTANVSAGLLMNEDLEYYPVEGQMMTWRDLNGKLHLSRYEPNTPKNNGFGALNWRTAVYDAVNNSIIVESKSGDNASPASGKFFVTRSVNGGWTWTPYNDVDSPVENWGVGAYYNGTAVFISRNTSQEIEYTTDGGLTWVRTNLPSKTRWDSVWWDENGRWVFHAEDPVNLVYATNDFSSWENVSSDYPSGCRCYFLPNDPTRYPYSGKTSDWMCMAKRTIFGMKQDVLMVKTSSGWQNFFTFGEGSNATRHFPIQIQVESYGGNITKEYADLFVNDEGMAFAPILYLNSSLRYRIAGESSDWWIFPTMISLRRNKIYAVVSNGTNIYNASGSMTNLGSNLILEKGDVVISGTEAVNFIPYGSETESIFTFGGVKHSDAGFRQSSFNLFLTIAGESVIATPPDFWREIPLLDENKTGLVYQEGNEAKTIELGDYLEKRTTETGEEIGTIHSDRITPYANYMLKNSNGSVWCPVDVADMVDGVTKIYSDEECTTEIGVVTNHSYNPNNPLDVEVSIGGVTEVYIIDPTKIPKSLATTFAIIQAIEELKKKVPVAKAVWYIHNGVPSRVTGITYNNNTGYFEKTISNNVNDQVVTTVDEQPPALDYSNMIMLYTCIQVTGTFTTYVACVYTDGTRTAPLFLTV